MTFQHLFNIMAATRNKPIYSIKYQLLKNLNTTKNSKNTNFETSRWFIPNFYIFVQNQYENTPILMWLKPKT